MRGRDDKGVHESAGTKEKDITKDEVLKRLGGVMASVGTGGVEIGSTRPWGYMVATG